MTPPALAGRWRAVTMPAACTRASSRASCKSVGRADALAAQARAQQRQGVAAQRQAQALVVGSDVLAFGGRPSSGMPSAIRSTGNTGKRRLGARHGPVRPVPVARNVSQDATCRESAQFLPGQARTLLKLLDTRGMAARHADGRPARQPSCQTRRRDGSPVAAQAGHPRQPQGCNPSRCGSPPPAGPPPRPGARSGPAGRARRTPWAGCSATRR